MQGMVEIDAHSSARSDLEVLYVFGPNVRILATFGVNDDDPCLIEAAMPSGVVVPIHSHPDTENWFVESGTVDIYRDGIGWQQVSEGSSFSMRDGVRHALHNKGDVPVRMTLLTTSRMGKFFRAIGIPVHSTGHDVLNQPAHETLLKAAAEFGFWVGDQEANVNIGLSRKASPS